MKYSLFIILSLFDLVVLGQIEIPNHSEPCNLQKKNNFSYCLNTTTYKTQWTAIQIKAADIENKKYIPSDVEFFRDIPASISSVWTSIETQTKLWAMQFDSVYVVTGDKEFTVDSVNRHAYYKAILKGCQGDGLAFWVELDQNLSIQNIKDYSLTIRELEDKTNMDFFPSLNKDLQDIFETEFNWEFWPIQSE